MSAVDFKAIAEFFNNQSVGAALGAFAAFALVMLTDWRRERRRLKTLRAEVEVNLAHAMAKLETARRLRALLREQNKTTPAPVLRFNTAFTRQLVVEVTHHLSGDERRAIEGLCYTMEAIDDIFSQSQAIALQFTGPLSQAERSSLALKLQLNWADTVANLKRLIEMCEHYLEGRFSDLVNKHYVAKDYEEP